MVPDSRWVRLFRMFPFLQTGSLTPVAHAAPAGLYLATRRRFHVSAVYDLGRTVDNLWESWRKLHGCMVVRGSRTLPWKLGDAPYEVLWLNAAASWWTVGIATQRRAMVDLRCACDRSSRLAAGHTCGNCKSGQREGSRL